MKKLSTQTEPPAPSVAVAVADHVGITNASFRWEPSEIAFEKLKGFSTVYTVVTDKKEKFVAKLGLMKANNDLVLTFLYYAPGLVSRSEWLSVAKDQPLHLELDIDPKTSNVVYWVNDKGMDMGVLPGFKGGADRAVWAAFGMQGGDMLSGKLSNCAYATAAGWRATAFGKEHIVRNDLHPDHSVETLAHNSIAIGNSRFVA